MKRVRFDELRKLRPFPGAGGGSFTKPQPPRPLFARRTLGPKEFADRNFGLGYELDQAQRHDEATWVYRATIETLERWNQSQPEQAPVSLLAHVALRHGARLMRLHHSRNRRILEIQTIFRTAVNYAEAARQFCASSRVAEIHATALAWRGLSLRASGDFSSALDSYQKATGLWRLLLVFSRDRAEQVAFQRSLAAALFGTAKTLRLLGQNEEAARCRAESHHLFQRSRGSAC